MDVRMPDGTIVTNVPDNMTQEDLLSAYSSYQPPSENLLYGIGANITPSLTKGLGSFVQLPGKLADLVTGTAPGEQGGFARNVAGLLIPGGMQSVQSGAKKLEDIGQAAKTLGLQQKETERAEKIANTEGEINKFGVALAETIMDPSLTSSFVLEQLPNLLGPKGGGMLTQAAVKRVFKNTSEAALGAVGVSGAVATGAAMQGVDIGYETYKDIYDQLISEGQSPETANIVALSRGRVATIEAGGLAYALSRLPGAREVEKALFKQTRQAIPKAGATSATRGAITGASGTSVNEAGEEVGGKFISNVGKQEVFPETELTSGLGETGAFAVLGGATTGGVSGAINARSQANNQKRQAADAIRQAEDDRIAANAQALKDVAPDLTSPIVATTTTTIDGVDKVKVTRADGSVEIDGVLVEPPRALSPEITPPEVFYSEQPLPQEVLDQGYQLVDQREENGQVYYAYTKKEPAVETAAPQSPDGQLDLKPVNPEGAVLATPPIKPQVGQLSLAPVNPEGTVLPDPAPPVAAPVAQLPLAQVNPEGTILPAPAAKQASAAPVAKVTPTQTKRVAAEPTIRYGITDDGETGVPLTEGGKPFATRKEAEKIQKLQPQLRVLQVKSQGKVTGYVLADKTQKQIAAEKIAGKRLQSIPASGLLGDILRKGGINPVHRAELGFDTAENPVIGNRRLFAAEGKGISLSEITEGQEEESAAEDEFTGRDIDVRQALPERVKDALRRFNSGEVDATGVDALEQRLEAEFQDFLAAELEADNAAESMLDAGYTQQDLNVVGFTKASPELKAEVAALEAQMEALGLDASDIIAEIAFTPNITELEYYTRAKSELTKAIAQAAQQGSGGNVSQANVSSPSEGLESPDESLDQFLAQNGFTFLPDDSKRNFQDFPTFEKDGVRVALSNNALGYSKGRVMMITPFGKFSNSLTVQALIVDQDKRNQGKAREVMQLLSDRADDTETTLYVEPLPINDKSVKTEGLKKFYSSLGFEPKGEKIMVREPSQGITSPTQAGLKDKQEAIDKAAADKAQADRDVAAKDKAEADRKAIAAASEKASSEYVLGRSAEEDLSGQKPMFSKSIAEQKENADVVANYFSGKIVYQNGDISLIQGRDKHGNPMYLPAKGLQFYSSSIETLKNTSALFTKEESKELLDARSKIESEDVAKHAAKPFVTFSNGIATSQNVSAELEGIFKQWKSLLKLNQNIYLSTIDDALANKNNFAGPQRKIGNNAITASEADLPGITQSLADGTRYILIDQNKTPAELVEILAHEMGHAHEQEMFNNAPVALQNQIKAEFAKWLNSQKGKTAKEFIYALRAKETAETTTIPNPNMLAKDLKQYGSYWSTFSEWYADQTARWATTSEKPLTAVDKFFAKVAEMLRSFFKTIHSVGFLPNTTFKQYMDDITATEIVAANTFVPSNEQIPLFAIKTVQSSTVPSTRTPQTNIVGTPIAGTWSAAPETTLTPYIYSYQDKQVDLRDAQREIEKTTGEIDDALNAYRKETLYYGRVADQTDRFLKRELKPLLKDMVDKKLTLEEVDKYLQALHAEERNKSIANKVNGMPDGGAGINTADAKAYLAGLSATKRKDLDSISRRVRSIISGTQDIEVSGGLELQSKIDGWNKTWPNYVPLFRDEIDYVNSGSGMGQGFSTSGASSKAAIGSTKPVKEIIASLADQRQKAIVRSEKARVGKALYALAIANPNPDYWLPIDPNSKTDLKKVQQMMLDAGFDPNDISALVKNIAQELKTGTVKRVFNPITKQFDQVIKYETNTQNRYSSNVLAIRINGEDKFLFFNPSNERAKRGAEAIKNLDAEQLSKTVQVIGSITRFIAALSTQYNPIFGAINFARDVQSAALNLTTTALRDKKAAVVSGAFSAMKGIYKELRAQRAGGQSSGYYSNLYADFVSAGGKTGFLNQFSGLDKKGTIVERELKDLTKGRLRRAGSVIGGLLSDYNDMLENAVRLSAYEQGLKIGLSKEASAELAKNLTVNFNRKGASTATLGAFYMFFNANVQGTARLYETLKGPAGKKIIAGGLLLGAFQAALLSMADFDEDEPSEFIKQKNFIIPTFDGGYLMIPMPLGFNILPNIGRIISEISFGNKKSGTRKVTDLLDAVVSSFNPLGSGNAVQMIVPTIADPIANVVINKDSFGRQISKDDRSLTPSPGYLRTRDSVNAISKGIAEFLNYVSGGTEFNKGWISPTGDDINYVVGQYLGGVSREVKRAMEFIASSDKDEPFEPYKIPIVGKFYGDVNSPSAVASKFYLNVKQMAEHENEIKGRKGQGVSEYIRDNPDSRLYKSANNLENEISKLNKTKKQLIERNADDPRIRRIEDQKLRVMKQFNERVKELQ